MEKDRFDKPPRTREAASGNKQRADNATANTQNNNVRHPDDTGRSRSETSRNKEEIEDISLVQPEHRDTDLVEIRTNQDEQHRVTNAGSVDGGMEEQEREGV